MGAIGAAYTSITVDNSGQGRVVNMQVQQDIPRYLQTVDNGRNWFLAGVLDSLPLPNKIAYVFRLQQVGGRHLFAGTFRSGIWKSSTNGATWDRIDENLPDEIKAVEMFFASDSCGWVIKGKWNDSKIYRTRDSGTSWEETTPEIYINGVDSILSLRASPGWLDRMDSIDDETSIAAGVYLFNIANEPELYFFDEQEGFLKSGSGLLHTVDGGDTWEVYFPGIVLDFQFLDMDNLIVSVQDNSMACTLFHTNDGGKTFISMPTQEIGLYRFYFVNSRLGWSTDGRYIFHTVDSGATWHVQLDIAQDRHDNRHCEFISPPPSITELFFSADSTGYAIGTCRIFYRFSTAERGDLTEDGKRNIPDLLELLRILCLGEKPSFSTANLNADRYLNVLDLLELLHLLQ